MQTSFAIDLTEPDALTSESVARLIASANDRTHTQLRVTKAGLAFISAAHVGSEAAKDEESVSRIYRVLKDNWPKPSNSYIDLF